MFKFYFRLVIKISSSILHQVGEVINQMPDKEQLSHLFKTPFQRTQIWKQKKNSTTHKIRIKESTKQKGPKRSEQRTFNHPH